jgi:hypothetical protein
MQDKNHNTKTANRYFENVAKCNHLGMTVISQNQDHEKV